MSGWHLPFGGPSLGWDEALAQEVEDEQGDRCHGCGEALPGDEVLWATPEGRLTVSEGLPWCAGCAPEEPQN